MLNARFIAATVFASALLPVVTQADPFNPKLIPAEAKWVLHVDLDAARETKSLEAVRENFLSTDAAEAKIAQIEQITGTKIPDDLDDVTLYGKDAGEEAGVILVHGNLDAAKTQNSLEMADQFASNPYGNYAIFTWFDKEKSQMMFAAFHDKSNLIVGRTEEKIQTALDAMDGKTASITPDSPLVGGANPQLLLYVAAKDIPQLHKAGEKTNPIINSLRSAWICLSEKQDKVTVHAQFTGASAETASNLRTALEGLKSMLTLAAGDENADPVAKAVVGASKSFATTQQDQAVIVDWPVSVDQMSTIVKAIAEKRDEKN
jgi:hypothetical protein